MELKLFFFMGFIFYLLYFSQSVKTLSIVRTAWANVYTDARTLSCFLFYGLRRSSGADTYLLLACLVFEPGSGTWQEVFAADIVFLWSRSSQPTGLRPSLCAARFFPQQTWGERKRNYFCELCCVVLVSAALYPHEFKQKLKPSQDETLSSTNTEGSSAFGILLTRLSQQLKLYLRYLLI